jgi:hypothetical protein
MVDVGDNGEISKVFYVHQGWVISKAVFQFTWVAMKLTFRE